jgi:Chaperone of endosialidase
LKWRLNENFEGRDDMFDFPSAPAIDQVYSAHGASYYWNGYAWVMQGNAASVLPVVSGGTGATTAVNARTNLGLGNVDNTSDAAKPVSTAQAAADALRVLKAGDTMSGALFVTAANPGLYVNKTASGQSAIVNGRLNGLDRWRFLLGNFSAESGSNTGSDFELQRFSDAAAYLGSPLSINRATGAATFGGDLSATEIYKNGSPVWSTNYLPGGTMTGDLSISKANPALTMTKAASGQAATIYSGTGGAARWVMLLGNYAAETGGNVGSDFELQQRADSGSYLNTALLINRNTGNATFGGYVSAASGLRLAGTPFALQNGNYHQLYDPGGSIAIHLGNVDNGNYYSNAVHYFRAKGGSPTYMSVDANGASITGTLSVSNIIAVRNTPGPQYNPAFVSRYTAIGAAHFEWGHSNTAGYGATLGCHSNSGHPYVAFNAGPGTGAMNTFKTFGIAGTVIIPDQAGGITIGQVANSNADNQNLTSLVSISGAGVLRIHNLGTGAVQSTSGTLSVSSDARLKNIVGPYRRGLDDLKRLGNACLYRWKSEGDDSPIQAGFVAQDVQDAIPEAVNAGPDGMLGLYDRPIIAALVNAVKELSARVEALEAGR